MNIVTGTVMRSKLIDLSIILLSIQRPKTSIIIIITTEKNHVKCKFCAAFFAIPRVFCVVRKVYDVRLLK